MRLPLRMAAICKTMLSKYNSAYTSSYFTGIIQNDSVTITLLERTLNQICLLPDTYRISPFKKKHWWH